MFNILYIDKIKLLLPMILLSVISFEITLYPYYAFTSMIAFLGMLFFVFYHYKINEINE